MPDFSSFQDKLDGLQFLRQKELDGDLIHLIGGKSSTLGVKITYTPAIGKTFFLIKAGWVMNVATGSPTIPTQIEITLKYDSVIIDNFGLGSSYISSSSSGAQWGMSKPHTDIIAQSLVGNGVKKVEVEYVAQNSPFFIFTSLLGWIEDT